MEKCEQTTPAAQTKSSRSPAEHLRPYWFKPGQSGNPKGGKKKLKFEDLVAKELGKPSANGDETKLHELARDFVEKLLAGQRWAMKAYLEREWPPPKVVRVGGMDDDPVILEVRDTLCRLSSQDVEMLVGIGERLLQ